VIRAKEKCAPHARAISARPEWCSPARCRAAR
jgi:hypothetical protein